MNITWNKRIEQYRAHCLYVHIFLTSQELCSNQSFMDFTPCQTQIGSGRVGSWVMLYFYFGSGWSMQMWVGSGHFIFHSASACSGIASIVEILNVGEQFTRRLKNSCQWISSSVSHKLFTQKILSNSFHNLLELFCKRTNTRENRIEFIIY